MASLGDLAEKLPEGVLGFIFEHVIHSSCAYDDRCHVCRLPYSYIIRSSVSKALQLVCRRWRRAWRDFYFVRLLCDPNTPWCVTPRAHMSQRLTYLKWNLRHCPQLPFPVTRLNALRYNSPKSSASESSTDESLPD